MHRLFLPAARLREPQIELTLEQARYLGTVLRLKAGEEIEVFDGEGARFRARLMPASGREGMSLRLEGPLAGGPQRAVDVVLVQSLARGERMDLVVQKATELGAARIVPLAAERAVVRLEPGRGGARAERWRRVAQEAARQCGRAEVPRIDEPCGWEFVLGLLREQPLRRGLLLDPGEAGLRLGEAARGARELLLAVGPEGGFSPEERARAVQAGMLASGLGPLILRTETAGLAALAVVLHVHGELG